MYKNIYSIEDKKFVSLFQKKVSLFLRNTSLRVEVVVVKLNPKHAQMKQH